KGSCWPAARPTNRAAAKKSRQVVQEIAPRARRRHSETTDRPRPGSSAGRSARRGAALLAAIGGSIPGRFGHRVASSYSVLSTQYSVLSTQYSVLSTEYVMIVAATLLIQQILQPP